MEISFGIIFQSHISQLTISIMYRVILFKHVYNLVFQNNSTRTVAVINYVDINFRIHRKIKNIVLCLHIKTLGIQLILSHSL